MTLGLHFASKPYDSVMPGEPWAYFDGNAITKLWDWYTYVHPDGQTGDPRGASPFQHAVISDYGLDEIVTNPIGNAYVMHVHFLTIFPDIPVLQSLNIVDIPAAQADRTILLRPADYIQTSIGGRWLALVGHPEAVAALEQDVGRKQARIKADIDAAVGKRYVPKEFRVPFSDAIAMTAAQRGLDPAASAHDFFALCEVLYSYEVSRFIDRPSRERKGPSRQLNQQIDHYHLSYLPFVDAFVTDDVVLHQMAKELGASYYPNVEIDDVDSYLEKWIRRKLLE